MTWVYPPKQTMVEVAALHVAAGITAPHLFGARHLATSDRPPYYVWVPRRMRSEIGTASPGVEEIRTITTLPHIVDVHCAGADEAQSWAMANNLIKSVNDLAAVDASVEGGRWISPGESYNQDGEVFIVELSLNIPFIDALIDLDTLADPTVSTVLVDSWQGSIYRSPNTATDGELALIVDTEDP
jgi:hypothetical protein